VKSSDISSNVDCFLSSTSLDRVAFSSFSGASDKVLRILFVAQNGNKIQQQNPKCQQFILVATCQAPENHSGTLRCDFSTPNPVVFFPMGQ
jgi:hypothetical protein